MLTSQIMGFAVLAVLWVNALLILGVAIKELRHLRAFARRVRRAAKAGSLVTGRVKEAPDGRLALRRVSQCGRARTSGGPECILFGDSAQRHEVLGGVVETAEGEVRIEATERSEVWSSRERGEEVVGPRGDEFDEAYPQASKHAGFSRDVDVDVRVGDPVWVLGEREDDRLVPPADEPILVSMVDPLTWAAGRSRLVVAFLLGASLALVAITALVFWPPVFGTVSTIGAALGVVYFLGVQPIATSVRDAIRTPARQELGGAWTRTA